MTRKSPPQAKAAIGHNSQSSLAAIIEEWHRLDRDDLFARGKLLIKAYDTQEYTDWEEFCQDEFGISHDTARNLRRIAEVAARHENFRDLPVKKSILYELAGLYLEYECMPPDEPDHKNLPDIIAALIEAGKAKGRTLSIEEAEDLICYVPLRKKYGNDLPKKTLDALNSLYGEDEPEADDPKWMGEAVKQLTKDKPTTHDAANAIVNAHYRSHIETIYKASLPAWFKNEKHVLNRLESVPAKHRKKALKALQDCSESLSSASDYLIRQIDRACLEDDKTEQDEPKADEPKADDKADTSEPVDISDPEASAEKRKAEFAALDGDPKPLDAELIEAIRVIVRHAHRPMPTSVDGIDPVDLLMVVQFINKLRGLTTDTPARWRESA